MSESNNEVPEAPEPASDVLEALEKIGDTDEELLRALADVPDGEVDIMGSALSLKLDKDPLKVLVWVRHPKS